MFKVDVNITIGNYTFDFIMDGEINSSWKDITDKAVLKFPRNIKVFSQDGKLIQDIINKGDKVEIQLGYDGNLETEFTGYISEVQLGIPLVIHCEDDMWILKQSKVSQSWSDAKLEDIISAILPSGMNYEVVDFKIGAYYANQATPAIILNDLKKRYGMKPFFRDGVLYVGFAYPEDKNKAVTYDFSKNAKEKGKKLKYVRESDVKLRVKGISIDSKGEKIEYEKGDAEGGQRTLHYYNLSMTELQANVERDYSKLLYEGFRGSFRAFAIPHVKHGDIAYIIDDFYPEHKGAYFVDRVKTSFGHNKGIDRQIHLGSRASSSELKAVL